jgi:hypothetical protein
MQSGLLKVVYPDETPPPENENPLFYVAGIITRSLHSCSLAASTFLLLLAFGQGSGVWRAPNKVGHCSRNLSAGVASADHYDGPCQSADAYFPYVKVRIVGCVPLED